MFAVVRTGGKQYKATLGAVLEVEKLEVADGAKIELETLVSSENGAKVIAQVIQQKKGEKVLIFKKKRRHNYRRKNGHRQRHTVLQIIQIGAAKYEGKIKAAVIKSAPAPKVKTPRTGKKDVSAEVIAKAEKAEKPAKATKTENKTEKKPAAKKPAAKTKKAE